MDLTPLAAGLAIGLGASEALLIGKTTSGYPLVVEIAPHPAGFPSTGATRSFWESTTPSTTTARRRRPSAA